jgi:hypothetical protein
MGSTLIVLFIVLMLRQRGQQTEGFYGALDMPSGNALTEPPVNAVEANQGFGKVLSYLSKNPKDSGEFLNFLKSSFFTQTSQFNPDIQYSTLQEKWKGGIFRDKSTDV